MIKTQFSSHIDEPRLSQIRTNIFKVQLWDEYLEHANFKRGFIGDEQLSTELMINSPSTIIELQDKMLIKGRFVFGFMNLQSPHYYKIAIEKFEIRRGFFGPKHGFWAEISIVGQEEHGVEPRYLYSSSLPDLYTKLFAMFVQKVEVQTFSKNEAKTAMMNY